ncbi:MAG: dockerin type I domain-containing protein [Fimbriimonadales bacterium]|nr:dockerin type I domain-containing protein [Fimbriimonadales bacterium]
MKQSGCLRIGALMFGLHASAFLTLSAQSLTWLGTLYGGSESIATGVSADGSVVVGTSYGFRGSPDAPSFAFIWRRGVGMQDLLRNGGGSAAAAVSADGTVVVGSMYVDSSSIQAYRWSTSEGLRLLGTLGGLYSYATAVSANGSVVVGYLLTTDYRVRPFRWTAQTGMRDLGSLGGVISRAQGVSADGTVVVGTSTTRSGARAFRWTEAGGMQSLGTLPGTTDSYGFGISANGAVVVGYVVRWPDEGDPNQEYYERAFRWENGTMQSLGTLYGYDSFAYAASADGAVVVGWVRPPEPGDPRATRAFRWTAQTGIQDLNLVFANLLTDGSELKAALAISPDGRYIVGQGYRAATRRNEAFVLDTRPCDLRREGDLNADGIVNDADLLIVLLAFGQTGANNADVNGDGAVNDTDLLIILVNFGSRC